MALKRKLLAVCGLLLLLVHESYQHGNGAPRNTCQNLTPNHRGTPPQTSPSPYTLVTSASQVRQGDILNITIRSSLNAKLNLAGFIVQAREIQRKEETVGHFVNIPNEDDMHFLNCSREQDTVTHSNSGDKATPLTLQWMAPDDFLGSVEFRATVAKSFSEFWTGLESNLVEVVTKDTIITTAAPRPTEPSQETHSPILEPTAKPKTSDLDPIYQDCGRTKLCFGAPENCIQNGNCKAVVAITVAGDTYTFELQGTNDGSVPKYVAAGLSKDTKMGQDSAMECVRNDNDRVTLHTSFTCSSLDKPCANRGISPQEIVHLLESSVKDQKLYCKFTRDSQSEVSGNKFDLINDKFNLMVVAGSSMKENPTSVGFHDIIYQASNEAVALADVANLAGSSKTLIKLHGSFMLFAWIGTASVGILLARYFRQTWVGKQVGGKDVWFAYHRMLMVVTWVLTVAASILIMLEVGGWSTTGDNPHAITGSITVLLCFFQPIGAYFRPHPGTKRRPVFNWLHWLAGNSAYILAMVTIFAAVYLRKAELPSWTVFVMALFVIFHVVMHIVLSFSSFRRLMLSVYVPVVLIVAIIMILLVCLVPISSN